MHADLSRVRPRSGRAVQLQSTSLESWEHTAPPPPYRPDPAWTYSSRLAVAAENLPDHDGRRRGLGKPREGLCAIAA